MAFVVQNKSPLAHGVDTKIFASNNLVQPQTVRKGYSINGAYQGVVPIGNPPAFNARRK